ncbi:hypothetical protein [Desulfoglaeba alkanexedens]|uniref:Uncharacterized protein n=1 Tax=Desulfoglaeba alkanexedens ALDC TaxID=980445 RepID=A0A4P8L731_9BACT|nr:hypothetical protein [Desulfoglaeba alkanexedens]QCQ22965.1 hypothetical protein FDQ92_12780 [Desulfoglaeba alkanexedens ALDC]
MRQGLILILGLLILAGGCTACPSRLELASGASFQSQKFNQILDPEAGRNLKPVESLDSEATEIALEKYRESFKKPREPEKFLMEIGRGR